LLHFVLYYLFYLPFLFRLPVLVPVSIWYVQSAESCAVQWEPRIVGPPERSPFQKCGVEGSVPEFYSVDLIPVMAAEWSEDCLVMLPTPFCWLTSFLPTCHSIGPQWAVIIGRRAVFIGHIILLIFTDNICVVCSHINSITHIFTAIFGRFKSLLSP
jgi:hypothetical protein